KGITKKLHKHFLEWGANVIPIGNHIWDIKEIFEFIDEAKNMVRQANFPEGTAGKGMTVENINGTDIAHIDMQDLTYLPAHDDHFRKLDQLITEAKNRTNIIFVDFHAETTSEKQAIGWYIDGRVSAVVGTHTHTQTADERILPSGT